ncbi:UNVERIFIED_CONTAM: hypothetical protein PYX00_005758 [Menopon gallinae]|uniref:Sulfide:quinone oxidoreductase, mitochondrial n=1 Tax=Menopon gallinae TaxID=328185 RepID=A0AAW2HTH2_9NEOP
MSSLRVYTSRWSHSRNFSLKKIFSPVKFNYMAVAKLRVDSFATNANAKIFSVFKPNGKPLNNGKQVRYRSESREKSCKLLIVGGGAGGCTIAAKFAPKLGKSVIVVEPSDVHYYQPMFTLIGGGMKKLKDSVRHMKDVLPSDVEWIKDSVQKLEPQRNYVMTQNGTRINYEFLVVAAGLKVDFTKIPGLLDGLTMPGSGVCSNYSPNFVEKTYSSLDGFVEGNVIFTYPNTPVKCGGAPQKICYIAEEYLQRSGKRRKANVIYNTSLGVIFPVKKYADSLWQVCNSRGIDVNLKTNLVAIEPERRVAVFENLNNPEVKTEMQYSVLHVTPPMGPPPFLRCSPMICDDAGYLDIDKNTLRHKFFSNIFGIGDCTSLPTSKTAAAVAAQSGVLYDNLLLAMSDQPPASSYNGYTSCPLVTGYSKCILAEFDYDLQPLETMPFDQGRESMLAFHMKKDMMPFLYWNFMLRGYWNGPEIVRKILHMDFREKRTVAGASK